MQIYLITNRITKENYVGQTIWDFNRRYKDGLWHKRTHSKVLKESVSEYGVENFTVTILEPGVPNKIWLDDLEDFYINKYNCIWPNGFNKQGGGKRGYECQGKEYKLKDVNGDIHIIKNLRKFCYLNNFHYGAMLNMVSGINDSSYGYALESTPIEKIRNMNEEWELEEISTGFIYKVKRKDIPDFAKSKNIDQSFIYMIVSGKVHISQGFKLKSTIIDGVNIKLERVKYKNIRLLNPKGEEVIVDNIYKFAMEIGLPRHVFYDLIKGKSLEAYGWRLPCEKEEFNKKRIERRGKSQKLRNIKTNEVFTVKNISEFCRKNNLNINTFGAMVGGYIKQYMGYCLVETDMKGYRYPKKIIFLSIKHEDGTVLEGFNAKEIEKNFKIASSQSIQDMINNKCQSVKGWRVLQVKYKNNYYPEINNTI